MMQLLAKITKFAIDNKIVLYNELYYYDEEKLFKLFKEKNNKELNILINQFKTIKASDS